MITKTLPLAVVLSLTCISMSTASNFYGDPFSGSYNRNTASSNQGQFDRLRNQLNADRADPNSNINRMVRQLQADRADPNSNINRMARQLQADRAVPAAVTRESYHTPQYSSPQPVSYNYTPQEPKPAILKKTQNFISNEPRIRNEKEQAELKRQKEETDRLAEIKRQKEEAARQAEIKRQKEEAARQAEIKRQKEEAARQAEIKRQKEEAARQAEIKRQKEEAARQAEIKRQKEEATRQAEIKRQKEEAARQAEIKRQKEEADRQAEIKRQKEEADRQAEIKRQKEEAARQAEIKRQKEEAARQAEQRRQTEEERQHAANKHPGQNAFSRVPLEDKEADIEVHSYLADGHQLMLGKIVNAKNQTLIGTLVAVHPDKWSGMWCSKNDERPAIGTKTFRVVITKIQIDGEMNKKVPLAMPK